MDRKDNRKAKRTERIDLTAYHSDKYRNKYRHMSYIPLPIDVKWKALILTMRSGEWMTIGYIQQETRFSRKRVRNLLKKGIQSGIIEKGYEESWQQPPRSYHSKGQGWLYRQSAYYRLRMDKIQVILK